MSKGSSRRPEDREAIEKRWPIPRQNTQARPTPSCLGCPALCAECVLVDGYYFGPKLPHGQADGTP